MYKIIRYFIVVILLNTAFNNKIFCMQANITNSNSNTSKVTELPPEVLSLIVKKFVKSSINNWNDVFNFDNKALKNDMDRISLICGSFKVYNKDEMQRIVKKLKLKRFRHLKRRIKAEYDNLHQGQDPNVRLMGELDNYSICCSSKEAARLVKNIASLTFAGADVNTKKPFLECTPLIMAVKNGKKSVANALLCNGADINISDCGDTNALMWAVTKNHKDIVKLLIDNGADINAKSNDGRTALIYAAMHDGYHKDDRYCDVAELLIKGKDNVKADVNIKDEFGDSALSFALRGNSIKFVNLLKQAGALG